MEATSTWCLKMNGSNKHLVSENPHEASHRRADRFGVRRVGANTSGCMHADELPHQASRRCGIQTAVKKRPDDLPY